MDLLKRAEEKKVLLVAHRGVCGGNIPCNSLQAFQAAVLAGADVVELDVERTADWELFIQHPGFEHVHLRMADSIKNHPAWEVEGFRLSNQDHAETQYRIPRLVQALELLRGKCFVNIDKFWENPKEIAELVRTLGMEEQVIIKTDAAPVNLEAVERYAPDIPFMAIIGDNPDIHGELMNRRLRYIGAEVLFDREDAPTASPGFVERVHRDGRLLWANAIVYDYRAVLTAGHNDDVSVTEDPEKGWGWLADRGFDLIQTDFLYPCRLFLEKTGRRNELSAGSKGALAL